jgi:hypothetical protein
MEKGGSMKVNRNICKKVKNIISWKVYHDEPTCFEEKSFYFYALSTMSVVISLIIMERKYEYKLWFASDLWRLFCEGYV